MLTSGCRLLRARAASRAASRAHPLGVLSSLLSGADTPSSASVVARRDHRFVALFGWTQQRLHSTGGNGSERPTLTKAQVLNHVSLMENWSCSGCGIELQHEHPKEVGYLPPSLLENLHDVRELKKLQCERCFQMTQYGRISDARMPYHEYEKRVRELREQDMLMVQLVDILDIDGSLLPKARHLFGKKPVMLVVNKGDLIPERSGIRRLMRHIRAKATEAGIENIIAIYLVSAMKGIGMREIILDVKKHRNGRDICVVGAANVGKSTFLNSFMKFLSERKWQHNHRKYMKLAEVSLDELQDDDALAMLNIDASDEIMADVKQLREERASSASEAGNGLYVAPGEDAEMVEESSEEDRAMTTSPLPGTTLAVQHLPVMVKNEVFNILDTPGLITDSKRQKLVEVLATDGAARLTDVFPTKKLPVTTYRVTPGRSLFLGGLARFDYELTPGRNDKDKDLLLLSWYGVLPGHLTKTENAEDTFIKHAGGLLSPPRGLDALSYTGPLVHSQNVYLKDYITSEVQKKAKNSKKPKRTTVVELELPGFGWLAVTAVDLDGTEASAHTLEGGKISIHTCRGLTVVPRVPLFPFEMSTSKSSTWKS